MDEVPISQNDGHLTNKPQPKRPSPVQAAIDILAARVDTFEHELQDAMASEHAFRKNLHTVTQALDSFFKNHRTEDMHLTALIQEDSQRSREANEEYDILAARLDDVIRPNRSTKRVELLRNISLYISIFLSVVFMAPIHAVVWLFESMLFRLGYRRMDDSYRSDNVYGNVANGRRGEQNSRRGTTSSQSSTPHRMKNKISAPDARQRPKTRAYPNGIDSDESSPSPAVHGVTQYREADNSSTMPEIHQSDLAVNSESDDVLPLTPKAGFLLECSGENDSRIGQNGDENASRIQSAGLRTESPSWDSEDVFLDANAEVGIRSMDGAVVRDEKEARIQLDGGSHGEFGPSERPDWAEPFGSDETMGELSSFPSADFWKISEDDIRLEFLRRDANASNSKSNDR